MKSIDIKMGASISEILTKFGQPKKESEYNGYKVFWYDSFVPHKADILFLQNDQLVLRTYPADENEVLSNYIDKYGMPEKSVKYYSGKFLEKDSFETTMHFWPSQGMDVVSYGVGPSSEVFLLRIHESMAPEEYFKGIGSEFANNQVVSLQLDQTINSNYKKLEKIEVVSDFTASQSSALFWKLGLGQTLIMWIIISLAALLFLGSIVFFLFRRFKRNRRTLGQSLPTPPPLVQ